MPSTTQLLATAALVGSAAGHSISIPFERRQAALQVGQTPIGGGIDGRFLMVGLFDAIITIGGQNFRVQLDTGSSDLVVVSSACTECNVNAKYTPGPTAQLKTDQQLNITYLDGTGALYDVYTDTVEFAGISAPNVGVGAITSQQGTFESGRIDGLIGLAYPSESQTYSATGQLPVLDQFVQDGLMANVFTMCFNGNGKGGLLTLGGGAMEEMQYSPYDPTIGFYAVGIDTIAVGTQEYTVEPVNLKSSIAPIIDTGTTQLVIASPAYDALEQAICDAAAQQNINLCDANGFQPNIGVEMTADQLAAFPDITVGLSNGNASLFVPPTSYFQKAPNGVYLVGIANGDQYQGVSAILGDVALLGQTITFDRVNNRIGVAITPTCPTGATAQPPSTTGTAGGPNPSEAVTQGAGGTAEGSSGTPSSCPALVGTIGWWGVAGLVVLALQLVF